MRHSQVLHGYPHRSAGIYAKEWYWFDLIRILEVLKVVSFPDPPPKRKGGSSEYSAASHHGLAVTMDSAKKLSL